METKIAQSTSPFPDDPNHRIKIGVFGAKESGGIQIINRYFGHEYQEFGDARYYSWAGIEKSIVIDGKIFSLHIWRDSYPLNLRTGEETRSFLSGFYDCIIVVIDLSNHISQANSLRILKDCLDKENMDTRPLILADEHLDALRFEDFIKLWTTHFKNPNEHILILEKSHTPLGFICYGPCEDSDLQDIKAAEIYAIYFDQKASGKGYGVALHETVVEKIRSEGYDWICVKILTSHHHPRRFYEQLGFLPDKVFTNNNYLKDLALIERRYLLKLSSARTAR